MNLANLWAEQFDQHIQELVDETGTQPETWKTAGRKTKAKPSGEDVSWWRSEGLVQIVAYQEWLRSSGIRIATMSDGQPGIEWSATVEVQPGLPQVVMAADLIVEAGPGQLMVIDNKTGSRIPDSHQQLGLYATGIELIEGTRPKIGAYYMTRQAILTDPESLDIFGIHYWRHVVNMMDVVRQQHIFVPKVGTHCHSCGVQQFCGAVGGVNASGVDVLVGAPTDPVEMPPHLSWSQISSWLWCGKQYELTRLRRVEEQPAVWLAAGSAIHSVFEQINLDHYAAQV